jgi:hypothetical protein
MKRYNIVDGLCMLTDGQDSVIVGAGMVSVSYNRGCSYRMPHDEFNKHWHNWESWPEEVLLKEAKELIENTKNHDPFKGLTVSCVSNPPRVTKKKTKK